MEENIKKTEEHLSKVSLEDQNKDSRSTCELSEDDQDIFTALITNAKQRTTEGNIKDALDLYKQALKMYYNEKLERKIHKMEAYLQKTDDNSCSARRGSTPLQKSEPDIRASPQEEISEDNQEIYNQMISSARQMVNEGKIRDALELNKEALKIYYNEKLAKKITKMEMYLKESGEGEVQGRSDEGQGQGRSSVGDTPMQVSTGISTEDKEIFDQLMQSARQYTEQGKIKDALELYREAIKMNDNEKLAKRIDKMEQYLKEAGEEQVQKNVDERESQEPCSKEESMPELPSETPKKTVVNQRDQETYNQLIETAKQCTDEGHLKDALDLYREALKIYNSEKLAKKIVKIETYLKENDYSNRENKNQESMESKDTKTQVSQAPIKSEDIQDDQEKFNKLVTQAKKLISDGQVREALKMNKEALQIYHSDKLANKIKKMEKYLKEHGDDDEVEEDENGMVHVGNGYFMYKELYNKLYDHQKEAVLWMWGLHRKRKGGILGDDMGLGKTIQIISFLSGLFDMDKVHAAIIVMPVSLIINWEKEFQKWAPGIRVTAYHGSSKKEKERVLSKVQRRGGVILTSYGLVVTSWDLLGKQDGREFIWDYMILDEGHKIKNPTKTTKGVHAVPARNRIILTGTPIQNNLKELWSLFDFVHQGALLGTARTFKMEYENPITRARERDATVGERKLGQEMAESLKKIMAPYFLRRTKAEVTETKSGIKVKSEDEGVGKMPSLTRKNDLILWVFLTQTQQKIYHDFLSLDTVKELLMTKKSPLVALTVLKKITDHPRLLSTRAVAQLGLDDHGLDEDQLESEVAYQSAVNQIKNVDDQTLINESGKLIVLVELLDKLKEEGHRTLVFSQSRKLLDIIDKVISGRGHKVMRLDGTITHLSERDQRMKKFHSDDRYSVFLLTTQVGGVGLTLTAADRVVIYDPSWNPATDAQAVDRAFRIGQEKNVVIYRLITCGTVEEKIYRRQIFKDSITRQTTGNTKNPYRYFTKQELRELFQLNSPRVSSTQQQLEQMHSGYRKTDESLDAHIAYLYSLDIFGISDHDLMFGEIKDNKDDIDEEYKEEDSHLNGNDYIQARVQKAQERIKMESDLSQPMSHYPSAEGQSNRPRGPQEWNMPNGLPQPSGGPDNVVDMRTADDSDTEMVDLTESPEKNDIKTHAGSPVSKYNDIKQESPQQLDHTGHFTTRVEHVSPNMKSNIHVSQPVSMDIGIKSELRSPTSESESTTPDLLKKNVVYVKNINENSVVEGEEIIIESDEENNVVMENEESITINSDDESNKIDRQENNVVMENEESIITNSDDENSNIGRHVPQIDSDDVMMITPTKTPSKGHLDNMTIDSPMKIDSEDISSPQRTPLKSIENVSKGLGSAVKLFGGQIASTISSIVSMVTPERQKTPGKSRRKSVSQSPWLAKTPRSGKKNVISEELLISPDACRPLMTTSRKLVNIPLTSHAMTEARMNSTIMSAFGTTPPSNHSVGSSRSSGSNSSDRGESFVGESPSPRKRFGSDLVQDSPLNDGNISKTFEESASLVLDSEQNTPAVINDSDVMNMSNVDSTPKSRPKLPVVQKIDDSIVNESDDESDDERNNDQSDDERNNDQSDDESNNNESDDEMNNDESDDERKNDQIDSPIATSKQKKRKAVIESSEEESDNENVDESMNLNESEIDEDIGVTDEKVSKSKTDPLSDESDNETEDRTLSDESDNDNNNETEDRTLSDESDNYDEAENRRSRRKYPESKVRNKQFEENESESGDEEYNEEDNFIDDDDDVEESDETSEEEDDFDNLSDVLKNQFSSYVTAGRSLYKKGNYNESLVNILQALEIYPHNEVQALALKINKKIEGS